MQAPLIHGGIEFANNPLVEASAATTALYPSPLSYPVSLIPFPAQVDTVPKNLDGRVKDFCFRNRNNIIRNGFFVLIAVTLVLAVIGFVFFNIPFMALMLAGLVLAVQGSRMNFFTDSPITHQVVYDQWRDHATPIAHSQGKIRHDDPASIFSALSEANNDLFLRKTPVTPTKLFNSHLKMMGDNDLGFDKAVQFYGSPEEPYSIEAYYKHRLKRPHGEIELFAYHMHMKKRGTPVRTQIYSPNPRVPMMQMGREGPIIQLLREGERYELLNGRNPRRHAAPLPSASEGISEAAAAAAPPPSMESVSAAFPAPLLERGFVEELD